MAAANVPTELFLQIGEAVRARFIDHIDTAAKVKALVHQAGDFALAQVQQENPHLTLRRSAEAIHSEYYNEVLHVFLQSPAQLYAENPQHPANLETIEQAWTGLKSEIAKDFFSAQPEQDASNIAQLSDHEALREQPRHIL